MGTLKEEMLHNTSEDIQQHRLTDNEIAYLKLCSLTLQYHTMAQRIITGFLYYVAVNRLGYADTPSTALAFEIDLQKDDHLLTIKVVSQEELAAAAAQNPQGQAPPAQPDLPA